MLFSLVLTGQLDYSDKKGDIELENLKAVYLNGKVVSYVSSVNHNFKKDYKKYITVLNLNADEIFSLAIENGANISLVESAYNGENYAFLFLDKTSKSLGLKIFDKEGVFQKEISKSIQAADYSYFTSHIANNFSFSGSNEYLHEIGKDGFVLMYNLFVENHYTSQILKINLDTTPTKSYVYKIDNPIMEARYLGKSKNQLYFSFQKSGTQKQSLTADVLALDRIKWEQVYEINQTGQLNQQFFPQAILKNENTDTVKFVGYYFNVGNDMLNNFYDGFAYWELETKGDFLSEKYVSFQKDIFDMKFNKDNKGRENGYLLMQDVIGTSESIYVITEGFKKVVSGAAVSYSVMGMGTYRDYTQLKTLDLAILQFDQNFNYQKTTILEKYKNLLQLGFNIFQPIYEIGKIFNQFGLFDYLHTEKINENSISIFYKDFNQNTNAGRNYAVSRYSIDENGENLTKIEKQPNTSSTYFFPNGNGRIMIAEMIKKKIYFDFKSK